MSVIDQPTRRQRFRLDLTHRGARRVRQVRSPEDDTYEFDVPLAKGKPMEAHEPGKCPECKAPGLMHLKRTQQRQ